MSSDARVEGMARSKGTLLRLADRVASSAIAALHAVGRPGLPNVGTGPPRIEHAFTPAAAKGLLCSSFGSQVLAKLQLHARVTQSGSAATLGNVLPVGNVGTADYIDLTATPVEPSAPIASTRRPRPERVCGTEGH